MTKPGEIMPTITLSDARSQLPKLLADVTERGERYVITRSGQPTGVLLSVDEYEGLLETLDVLADTRLAGMIRQGLEEASLGKTISHQELWSDLDCPEP